MEGLKIKFASDLPKKNIVSWIKKIVDNEGYCLCAITKTDDNKCMCKEFRELKEPGVCHCGLYEKVKNELQ